MVHKTSKSMLPTTIRPHTITATTTSSTTTSSTITSSTTTTTSSTITTSTTTTFTTSTLTSMVDGTPIDMMAHPLQADGSPVFVLGSCSLDSIAGNRWSMTTTYDDRLMMNYQGCMMDD